VEPREHQQAGFQRSRPLADSRLEVLPQNQIDSTNHPGYGQFICCAKEHMFGPVVSMDFRPRPTWPAAAERLRGKTASSLMVVRNIYIVQYMKTLIVELDDEVAAKLERVAPGRARQRSEFIRNAVRRALWEIEEQATAEAYRRQPDSGEDAYIDAGVWETRPKSRQTRSRR
jgi:predicted transcriptional regulator